MIAGYVRVSTAEQAEEGYSIEEQSNRLRKYAEAMRWDDFRLFVDAGYSGGNMNRPALQEMVDAVKNGIVEKVVVYKLDRLSRSQLDTLFLIEKVFFANSCEFLSISESFDTSTPFGRAIVGILAVFAQLEREQIKERLNMGRDARAREGLFHGGSSTPYGYEYKDGQLIPNPLEAMQVEEIFRMYQRGLSVAKIMDELNQRDIPSRKGKWTDKSIRSLLRNKTYCGWIKYHDEWYEGSHEPLVSSEMYESVNALMDSRRGKKTPKSGNIGRASSILTGHLMCGCCGAKFGTRTLSQKSKRNPSVTFRYRQYVCYSKLKVKEYLVKDANCQNRNWNADELEGIIFGEISKLSLDAGKMETKKDSSKMDALKDELRKLDRQSEKLIELFTLDDIPRATLERKLKDISSQKDSIRKSITALEDAEAVREQKKRALSSVESLSDALEEGSFEEIRAIIDVLIDYIELKGDDINIHWNF